MAMHQSPDPSGKTLVPGDVVLMRVACVVTNARDVDQAKGAHGRLSVDARVSALERERR
ncbi:hypothetical protein BN2476_80055 [Paraburkholderia piptadeniae]|uniref:Uncharacterized protein n=1 Tax=Paraburkholderia piptadeniae TaxID=1701573 RepID=A0A1N7RLV4_9BURK|nr:hypothetical protein BN2476_80055 [Paraburkholderia piptadeniae]